MLEIGAKRPDYFVRSCQLLSAYCSVELWLRCDINDLFPRSVLPSHLNHGLNLHVGLFETLRSKEYIFEEKKYPLMLRILKGQTDEKSNFEG